MKISTIYEVIKNDDKEALHLLLVACPNIINRFSFSDAIEASFEGSSFECLTYLLDLMDIINEKSYNEINNKLPSDIVKHIDSFVGKVSVSFPEIPKHFVDNDEDLLIRLMKNYRDDFSYLHIVEDINREESAFDNYELGLEKYILDEGYVNAYKYLLFTQKNPEYIDIDAYDTIDYLYKMDLTNMLKEFIKYYEKYQKQNVLYEALCDPSLGKTKMLLENGANLNNKPIIIDEGEFTVLEFIENEYNKTKNDPPPTHKCFDPQWDKILELVSQYQN